LAADSLRLIRNLGGLSGFIQKCPKPCCAMGHPHAVGCDPSPLLVKPASETALASPADSWSTMLAGAGG
jgi:hypothetical protein